MVSEIETADDRHIVEINDFFNKNEIKRELNWFTHRDTIERAVTRDDREIYFLEDSGEIIGAAMVWCESRVLDEQESQIRLIAVDSDYRREGIATSLIEKCVELSEDFGLEVLFAETFDDDSHKDFWESCGFSEMGKRETKKGTVMVRMEKDLT